MNCLKCKNNLLFIVNFFIGLLIGVAFVLVYVYQTYGFWIK